MPADEPQADAGAEAEVNEAGPGAGARLKAARLEQNLTLEQVAGKLHLEEPVIVALEDESFATLGAPVFVRGYLKAYAILLGLSADEILALYQEPQEEAKIAPLDSGGAPPPAISPLVWGCGILAVIVMVALSLYIMTGDDEVTGEDSMTGSAVEMEPAARVEPDSSGFNQRVSGSVDSEPAESESALIKPPVIVDTPREPAEESGFSGDKVPQARAEMRLGLKFSQDSWVEISDVSNRLLFGLQRAGARELTGEAPFSVLIGNVQGVSLTVSGRDFDIPVTAIRGNVARFDITAKDFEQD